MSVRANGTSLLRRDTSPLTPLPLTPASVAVSNDDDDSDGSSHPSPSSGSTYQEKDVGAAVGPTTIDQPDLFYIDRIIARSVDKYPPHASPAVQEHRYLVRWWGEEPSSDTWEARSVLLSTARETVEAFDEEEHPFTILDQRNNYKEEEENGAPEYLVRYGWSSRNRGHSPHAEEVWHTASQAEKTMGISAITFENAVQAWREGLAPNPRAPIAVASAARPKKVPRRPTTRQGKPGYKLIRILDEQPDSRANPKHKTKWRVLVEYRIRRCKVRQEWFAKSYLTTLFGTEQVKQAREALEREAEQAQAEKEEDEPSTQDVVDAYEAERIKNIDENRELLRSLGLTP